MRVRLRQKNNNLVPIAYKAGVVYFCETPFFVNKNVLIPRFDTELLIETAVLAVKEGSTVLDLCSGSGCVGVVLAKHGLRVTSADVSRKALSMARKNARLSDVSVQFIRSDLFNSISGTYDAIVCNPPYVKTSDIGLADKTVLCEPKLALDGGADGLDFYRKIANEAVKYLNKNGLLALEIGYNQAGDVKTLLQKGGFCDIKIMKDLQGHDRVMTCTKN